MITRIQNLPKKQRLNLGERKMGTKMIQTVELECTFPSLQRFPCQSDHLYPCLENPRDGGSLVGHRLWGRTESDTTEAT